MHTTSRCKCAVSARAHQQRLRTRLVAEQTRAHHRAHRGSTNDVLARMRAPNLQEALGQPFIVENKPGVGGNIGADFVAKSPPDGHTLLVGYNGPLAVNVTLFDKMPYDPLQDLAPITL